MNNQNKFLKIIFWLLTGAAVGMILWKFFGSQEQPMETKILYVFLTFVFCAIAFRQIRKRAQEAPLLRRCNEAIEWWDTGISAVLLAFFIMSFVLQAFKIPSGSMKPTLLIGDHLFVNKFIYGSQIPFTLKKLWSLKKVKRFDVVVFLAPPSALSAEERRLDVKKDFIKRAIGLPGDVIEIKNKMLYINGEKAADRNGYFVDPSTYSNARLWDSQERYEKSWQQGEFVYLPAAAVRDNFGPVKVPADHFFVMGDNRDESFDARFWGPLPEKYLKGKAWLVYWGPSGDINQYWFGSVPLIRELAQIVFCFKRLHVIH